MDKEKYGDLERVIIIDGSAYEVYSRKSSDSGYSFNHVTIFDVTDKIVWQQFMELTESRSINTTYLLRVYANGKGIPWFDIEHHQVQHV